jgi:dinuclear metal center YbgI/SA1388 family protein
MGTLKIKDIISALESFAPVSYQEEYDNSGLLTGNPEWKVTGILVTLDCVEEIVNEAIANGCNLIVAHHPILFKGLKRITGKTYVERCLIKAIKHDVAIYAIHTNLDNVHSGVNKKIAERIGLKKLKILAPKSGTLLKLVTFIPPANVEEVMNALHAAGAGNIGDYKQCSFRIDGTGTFLPTGEANPHTGSRGKIEEVQEKRVEVILPSPAKDRVLGALRKVHPYEEVAFYLSSLQNGNQEVGSGIIGELDAGEEPLAFLQRLKKCLETECVRHTKMIERPVKKVAVCGGAGSFLLGTAISQGADAFVSADFKYHEFFDAEGKILVADVGHYESEQFTKELLVEVLKEKFPTFAINFSKRVTNPISYL